MCVHVCVCVCVCACMRACVSDMSTKLSYQCRTEHPRLSRKLSVINLLKLVSGDQCSLYC